MGAISRTAAVIEDYFALDESEVNSDDGDAGKPLCFVDMKLLTSSG